MSICGVQTQKSCSLPLYVLGGISLVSAIALAAIGGGPLLGDVLNTSKIAILASSGFLAITALTLLTIGCCHKKKVSEEPPSKNISLTADEIVALKDFKKPIPERIKELNPQDLIQVMELLPESTLQLFCGGLLTIEVRNGIFKSSKPIIILFNFFDKMSRSESSPNFYRKNWNIVEDFFNVPYSNEEEALKNWNILAAALFNVDHKINTRSYYFYEFFIARFIFEKEIPSTLKLKFLQSEMTIKKRLGYQFNYNFKVITKSGSEMTSNYVPLSFLCYKDEVLLKWLIEQHRTLKSYTAEVKENNEPQTLYFRQFCQYLPADTVANAAQDFPEPPSK